MKFIKDYKEGDRVFDIYLCKHKQAAVTKNGKPYETVVLQDKTGTVDGKIWDPNSAGIDDFDSLDYRGIRGCDELSGGKSGKYQTYPSVPGG